MDRRQFFATTATVGAAVLPIKKSRAANSKETKEFVGVLVDTTRCIGCRSCEIACAEAHGFPEPPTDDHILEHERQPSTTQWSVINRFMTTKGEVFAKRQCMHCAQ